MNEEVYEIILSAV